MIRSARWAPLREGAFLASSWTWCIGMFLPVLLLRDLGPKSFWVFAVPNCLGAAIMPVMLGAHAQKFRIAHERMIQVFSAVTIAFQAFFLVCLESGLHSPPWWTILLLVFFICTFLFKPLSRSSVTIAMFGVIALLTSLALGTWWLLTRQGDGALQLQLPAPELPPTHLLPMALVCALGFFLSPYLDGTFHSSLHRAHEATGRKGRAWGGILAFLIGFLLLFPLMIALTRLYAPVAVGETLRGIPLALAVLGLPLTLHITIQLCFTIFAHQQDLVSPAPHLHFPLTANASASSATTSKLSSTARLHTTNVFGRTFALIGIILGSCLGYFSPHIPTISDLSSSEFFYRLFMGFYGLVAPAYILTCAWPLDSTRPPARANWALFACVVALAAPFYYLGFIARETPRLYAGVAVVFLGWVGAMLIRPGSAPPHEPGLVPGGPGRSPPGVLAAAAQAPHEENS